MSYSNNAFDYAQPRHIEYYNHLQTDYIENYRQDIADAQYPEYLSPTESGYTYASSPGGIAMSSTPSTSSLYSNDYSSPSPLSPYPFSYGTGDGWGGATTMTTASQPLPRTTTRKSTSTRQQSTSSSSSSSSSNPEAQEKRYHCLIPDCGKTTARAACLKRHVTNVHFKEAAEHYDCTWNGCGRTGANGFTRHDKMIEHFRDVHHADLPKRQNGRRSESNGQYH